MDFKIINEQVDNEYYKEDNHIANVPSYDNTYVRVGTAVDDSGKKFLTFRILVDTGERQRFTRNGITIRTDQNPDIFDQIIEAVKVAKQDNATKLPEEES